MSAPRDLDRQIESFLADGPVELPEPSYVEVRTRMESTRQRAAIGRWKTSSMSGSLKYGLAAAAVALVAIFGYQLVGGTNLGGPGPSVAPSETPSSAPQSADPTAAALPEGPWTLTYEMIFGVRTTVTIPAPDWYGLQYITHVEKFGGANPPLDAKLSVLGGNLFVYGDPCAWQSTRPDAPAASLDELVAALTAQASRDATEASDVTVGGYPGKRFALQVPEDADFSACDGGEFRTLLEVSSSGDEAARVNEAPGQLSVVWVVDVDGTLVYFEASHFEGTPTEYFEEMALMVDSATFE